MITLNIDILRQIAPRQSGSRATSQASIIAAIGPVLQPTCTDYAIDTGLRAAHFLAQLCHESDGFCTTQEYADGTAYEGRADLGNTQPGDGPRFKGRGLIQLTGRANYKQYGDILHLDLVGDPELAAAPTTSLLVACAFWTQLGLNTFADQDDIVTITQRINGGQNGIASRRAYLARAKAALGMPADDADAHPTLQRGDNGPAVARLQSLLGALGETIVADGAFGPATEDAVRQFQTANGLAADGAVRSATWAALDPGA